MVVKKKGRSAEFLRKLRKKHGLGEFKTSRSTTRGQKKMPKRRSKRRTKSFARSSVRPMGFLVGGGIYGALRARLSNALSPITSKIPLGNIGDEVGLFALHYFLNKQVKNKIVKDITLSGMAVESARIGEAVTTGGVFGGNNGTASSSMTILA